MLLLITVMCVIAEKKLQQKSASLYVVVIFIIGGNLIGGGGAGSPGPPLATILSMNKIIKNTIGLSTLCVQTYKIFYALTSKVSYSIQNGAYECNDLTAHSVGGHEMVLNWMTQITDLTQFFVVSVKFGSNYASREVVLSF